MTRGERAANRFVRDVVPSRILTSFDELANEPYRQVLRACRSELRLGPDRGANVRKRIVAAVPVEYRRVVESALADLVDAEFDQRRVAARAQFWVGLAAGRALRSQTPRTTPRKSKGGAK